MQNRSLLTAIIAFILSLLIGSTLVPISIRPRHSIERENPALREEIRIYKQMVATFKPERVGDAGDFGREVVTSRPPANLGRALFKAAAGTAKRRPQT